jgi:hypothetical protein
MTATRRTSTLPIDELVNLIAAATSMKWSIFIVHKSTLDFQNDLGKISGRHGNTDNPCAVLAVVINARPTTNARRRRASPLYSAV